MLLVIQISKYNFFIKVLCTKLFNDILVDKFLICFVPKLFL